MLTPDHYTTVTATGPNDNIEALLITYGKSLAEYVAPFVSAGVKFDLEWKTPPHMSVESLPDGTERHRVFSRVRAIVA